MITLISPSPRRRRAVLLSGAVVVSVVLAACGSSDDDGSAATATTTVGATADEGVGVDSDSGSDVDVDAAAASASDDVTASTAGIDVGLFFDGALVGEPTIEDCTLSGGAETTCYTLTVSGYPTSYEVSQFCPTTITDEGGGLWWDGEMLYDLNGEFIENLAEDQFEHSGDLRLYRPAEIGNNITYMAERIAEGLSDTDIRLFGSMLMLTQQLMSRADEYLEPFGLTSRQWLLLAVLDKQFPGTAPSISEATAVFGTSRQNVKQVALQLARRGWLRVEPDSVDRRMLRLVLTDKRAVFHDPAVQADQAAFILSVFGGLTPGERRALLNMVTTCIAGLTTIADDLPTSSPAGGTS